MSNKTINTEQGHWLLAKMGKKVLRPGGRKLTEKLIEKLKIQSDESIVEFAPGMGYTANLLLQNNPKEYFGIELNEEAADRLSKFINGESRKIINTSASQTNLSNDSVHKVIGEAMLTMQADNRKSEIIREAYRILKPGGLYGIHELGLQPETISEEAKKEVQLSLAKAIHVNARPLTKAEWCILLENEGFRIKSIDESPMSLLKLNRIIEDEGLGRTLKILFNILIHPKEKKQIQIMKDVFEKYEEQLISFAIVVEK